MTSTEFNIGYDGSRASSKVLKPPGGGSSDIFGLGSAHYATNGEKAKQQSNNTQDRLFGGSNDVLTTTPAKTYHKTKSSIFENNAEPLQKSVKKTYVRRNPITGEEIEMNGETTSQKSENDSGENEKEENETKNKTEENKEVIEEKTEVPTRHVQTSIRIRNPPGGKSSGIF